MVQAPPSAPPTVQLVPALLGKLSESVTLRAMPGPALLTTMVKPIVSPELTGLASLVFVTLRSGHSTVIESEPVLLVVFASLVAAAVAELLTMPQVAEVVGELI